MNLLENPIQEYAWGSRTAIAKLLGRAPSIEPQAEMWMGAHPSAPSRILVAGQKVSLLDAVQREPDRMLGSEVVRRFGEALPFLLKVLAADQPLSIQAHPSKEQAQRGFEKEQALAIPSSAPRRCYKDRSHKPELLCALSPFEALCGLRPAASSLRLLAELRVDALGPIESLLRANPGPNALRNALLCLLQLDDRSRILAVEATCHACEEFAVGPGEFAQSCRWACKLGRLYPRDVGVIVSLLMNLVKLEPLEAIFIPAGILHGYLHGSAVEVMASSDNVLRGGLTTKHRDIGELSRIMSTSDEPVSILRPHQDSSGEFSYLTPAEEFRLSLVELRPDVVFAAAVRGPEILLCTRGCVTAQSIEGGVTLPQGASMFVPARCGSYRLQGEGTLFRATVPVSSDLTD